MLESGYQSKIIREIEKIGGVCVNGVFSKAGIADLQGGWPVNGVLHYIAIEVKSKEGYERVMKSVSEVNGRYVIKDTKSLKPHEILQITKLNQTRDKGGLAVLAYCIGQIKEYVNDTISTPS